MTHSIKIVHGRDGAEKAVGLAVVIDVLRAFSTACYLVAGGARGVITVADTDEARRLKRLDHRAVLLGERDGYQIPGFDLGNSPSQVAAADLSGRRAIFTTSNGTMGLAAAKHADEVISGSFVNAGAIVGYIRRKAPASVSLVCMGSNNRPAVEDTLCALYLATALKRDPINFKLLKRVMMRSTAAARFLASQSPDMPPDDLNQCLTLDRFEFVLRLERDPTWGTVLNRVDAA